jgi:Transposase
VCNSLPENPCPNHKLKESVAWKIIQVQVPAATLRWTSTSISRWWQEWKEILSACRVEHVDLENWAIKHLLPKDRLVIESTTNAWHVYDLLEPLVGEVLVANPIKVKQIACARVKTDKKDTFILVRLLAANLVPTVWVPPKYVRELRQLISHRRRMAGMHTQVVNRMHSVAHRHHLNHPSRRIPSGSGMRAGPGWRRCSWNWTWRRGSTWKSRSSE